MVVEGVVHELHNDMEYVSVDDVVKKAVRQCEIQIGQKLNPFGIAAITKAVRSTAQDVWTAYKRWSFDLDGGGTIDGVPFYLTVENDAGQSCHIRYDKAKAKHFKQHFGVLNDNLKRDTEGMALYQQAYDIVYPMLKGTDKTAGDLLTPHEDKDGTQ